MKKNKRFSDMGLKRSEVLSPEQRSDIASLGGKARKKALTSEERSAIASLGGKAKAAKHHERNSTEVKK